MKPALSSAPLHFDSPVEFTALSCPAEQALDLENVLGFEDD